MATRCACTVDVCSICGLCPAHCVGHVSLRWGSLPALLTGHAPLSSVRWGVRTLLNKDLSPYSGPQCAALLRISAKDGRMVQVGRSDTKQIPEEERESQGKRGTKGRNQERQAA